MLIREHDPRAGDRNFRVADAPAGLGVARAALDGAEDVLVEVDRARGAFHGDVRNDGALHGRYLACEPDHSGGIRSKCRRSDVRFIAHDSAFMYWRSRPDWPWRAG